MGERVFTLGTLGGQFKVNEPKIEAPWSEGRFDKLRGVKFRPGFPVGNAHLRGLIMSGQVRGINWHEGWDAHADENHLHKFGCDLSEWLDAACTSQPTLIVCLSGRRPVDHTPTALELWGSEQPHLFRRVTQRQNSFFWITIRGAALDCDWLKHQCHWFIYGLSPSTFTHWIRYLFIENVREHLPLSQSSGSA